MADIRDISMRARLPHYERHLGYMDANGQSTPPEFVRSFQNGTLTINVEGLTSPIALRLEGSFNKGQDLWFNLDPNDCDVEIDANGYYAATYNIEVDWFRILWVSGDATRIGVNLFASKNIGHTK